MFLLTLRLRAFPLDVSDPVKGAIRALYLTFKVKAYGDFSLAKPIVESEVSLLAEMTTQVYGADDLGFLSASWNRANQGWRLRNRDFANGNPCVPSAP